MVVVMRASGRSCELSGAAGGLQCTGLEGTGQERAGTLWQAQPTLSKKELEHSEEEERTQMFICRPSGAFVPRTWPEQTFTSGTW